MSILTRSGSWCDPSRYLKKIYIERSCADSPYVAEIIGRANLPVTIVDQSDYPDLVNGVYPENLSEGKTVLLLSGTEANSLKGAHQPANTSAVTTG